MERLHLVIAGNTDPVALRRVVDADVRRALLDLHVSGRTALIGRLHALGLATGSVPNLVVATEAEAERVSAHAFGVAGGLVDAIERRWDEIETLYQSLDISRLQSFAEAGLLFVGDFVLDIGLLDALAMDGTLMPPAPVRSVGKLKPGRYYLWLIKGQPQLLGQYGQRQIDLPFPGWTLTTYGQYFVNGKPNVARQELIDRVMSEAKLVSDPIELAARVGLSPISAADMNRWRTEISELLLDLVSAYKEAEESIRSLYAELGQGPEPERTFGEFFCWYDHLAYAHAIDRLAARARLSIPNERFAAAIVHPWSAPGSFSASG